MLPDDDYFIPPSLPPSPLSPPLISLLSLSTPLSLVEQIEGEIRVGVVDSKKKINNMDMMAKTRSIRKSLLLRPTLRSVRNLLNRS